MEACPTWDDALAAYIDRQASITSCMIRFMTDHTYQVIVRGRFHALSETSRVTLLGEADGHDTLSARFTEEGTFTYDKSLLAFTLRYLVTAPDTDNEDKVMARAVAKASTFLEAANHGYRDLTSVATDLTDVRIRRKGR